VLSTPSPEQVGYDISIDDMDNEDGDTPLASTGETVSMGSDNGGAKRRRSKRRSSIPKGTETTAVIESHTKQGRFEPKSKKRAKTTALSTRDSPESSFPASTRARIPMDIVKGEKDYTVWMDLPGVKKEDVQVKLTQADHHKILTVTAERKDKHTEATWHSRTWVQKFGTFTRSCTLPLNINEDAVKAKLEEGVLKITLPFTTHQVNKQEIHIF